MRIKIICLSLCLIGIACPAGAAELTPLELLGKLIFFDTNLSSPAGQSCASCHNPDAGFTGPDASQKEPGPILHGAVRSRSSSRKPPSAAYAAFSTSLSYDDTDETYVGGQFWDGRAQNLVEQAKGPFLNPVEMNNQDAREVVQKVLAAKYRPLFDEVYGLAAPQKSADELFTLIAQAIAAYESSSEVNSFSSKYDAYLAGKAELSPQEARGLDLFVNKANCAACHPNDPDSKGNPPLFTDFTYDNVGAPRNPQNPFYEMPETVNPEGVRYRDLGIGGSLNQPDHWGKVKVPTLRNVGKKPTAEYPKAYLHNGVFHSLKEVVHFYNARDLTPSPFADPDVTENVNREELGHLGLTDAEEDDLVAFLMSLSDGYFQPEQTSPGSPPSGPIANSGDPVPGSASHFHGAEEVARVQKFRQRSVIVAEELKKIVR